MTHWRLNGDMGRMFAILLLLFTCVPAFELYLLFKVGGEIGALNTILIIIVTGVVGTAMAKSQGLELLYKIQNELSRGALPTGQLLQGFLVMGGGLLLLTPGFVTDILGFAMVLPGSRAVLAALIKKAFARQIKKGSVHVFTSFGRQGFEQSGFNNRFENRQGGETFEAEYQRKDEKEEDDRSDKER